MSSNFYVINDASLPLKIRRSNYDSETQLETLVCDHPSLMSKHMSVKETILFVGRQINLGGVYMDALFVNENGVPIITEFKLAKNQEIKRGIISQIIQYAFSAPDVLNAHRLRSMFKDSNKENTDILERFDNSDFWSTVVQNIKQNHLYLAGVADDFTDATISYFKSIDNQMPNQSWYCIELTPYRVDQTNEMVVERSVQTPVHPFDDFEHIKPWNFVTTVNHIHKNNAAIVPLVQKTLTWLMETFPDSHFGNGDHYVSLNVYADPNRKLATLYVGRSDAEIQFPRWVYKQLLISFGCDKLEDLLFDEHLKELGKTSMFVSTKEYIKFNLAELSDIELYIWFQNKMLALATIGE